MTRFWDRVAAFKTVLMVTGVFWVTCGTGQGVRCLLQALQHLRHVLGHAIANMLLKCRHQRTSCRQVCLESVEGH